MNIAYIEMSASPGGKTRLNIVVDGDRTRIGELVNKAQCDPEKYEVEIKRRSTKRGLTANAYYWVLIDLLSKALGSSKDEVHEEMMLRYGTIKTKEDGRPAVFSLASGDDYRTVTKYARSFAEGMINGKRFVHYAVLKGSSEMTAKEFGDLLDGLISECKEMGIETMSPAEVKALEYLNTTTASN